MQFNSLNFKIVVLDRLLASGHFKPEWKGLKDKFYDRDNFDYTPVPELLGFCEKVEISTEQLQEIKVLVFDGGLAIYRDIIPNWDGEDNFFDVDDLSDAVKLTNLERISVISMLTTLDIEPLLELKSLQKIDWYHLNKDIEKAEKLRANGVIVTA